MASRVFAIVLVTLAIFGSSVRCYPGYASVDYYVSLCCHLLWIILVLRLMDVDLYSDCRWKWTNLVLYESEIFLTKELDIWNYLNIVRLEYRIDKLRALGFEGD